MRLEGMPPNMDAMLDFTKYSGWSAVCLAEFLEMYSKPAARLDSPVTLCLRLTGFVSFGPFRATGWTTD